MKIPFSPPDMTQAEANAAAEAVLSGWITTGPKTKELERRLADYVGTKRVACLASATSAMELALRVFGVGEGDEVITSAYTYTASASVIRHVGARVVLVDCLDGSPLIDPEAVRRAITPATKAVIPVDIGGVPADYTALRAALDEKKDIFCPTNVMQRALGRAAIVSDAAHSLGAVYRGKSPAALCDFTCYSFHAVKNFTTAEGGAVAFSDVGGKTADELYDLFMLWSLHGQNKDALAKTKLGAWEYDIVFPGYKCNMTDIMASIGLVQLSRYAGMLERRREMVRLYGELLKDLPVRPMPHAGEGFVGSHHLCITSLEGATRGQRDAVIERLAEEGVSANVHYKPLPMMTAYRAMGFDIKDFPNARALFEREVTLPLHTRLTDGEIAYVAESLKRALAKEGLL